METNYGSIPDIAVLKMVEQDGLDPMDPSIYHWRVQITPDQNHPLAQYQAGGLWGVWIKVSRHTFQTHQERYMYVYHKAQEAWVEYWNPEKYIEVPKAPINNDYFILGGAL